MKKITFESPSGCGIHLRGLKGEVTVMGEHGSQATRYILDPQKAISHNSAILHNRAGHITHVMDTQIPVPELQVFSTPAYSADGWHVTKKAVLDRHGNKVHPPSPKTKYTVFLAIQAEPVDAEHHIWLGWAVARSGSVTIEVLNNRNVMRRESFDVKPISDSEVKKIMQADKPTLKNHGSPPFRSVRVCDVVSLGFSWEDFQDVSSLTYNIS